jgi:hypothetical protein
MRGLEEEEAQDLEALGAGEAEEEGTIGAADGGRASAQVATMAPLNRG